jgi:hypothetical protein
MITDLLPIETTICERFFFVHIYGADYVAFPYLFEATQTGELFFEDLGIYMYRITCGIDHLPTAYVGVIRGACTWAEKSWLVINA